MKLSLALVLMLAAVVGLSSAQGGYDPARDARILLHTRQNRNAVPLTFDAAQIRATTFLASRPTRFVTHGWLGSDEVDVISVGVPALLDNGDYNVIVLDWNLGASSLNYALVVSRAAPTGRFLATFLDFLHQNALIDFARVHVIGFSLGGHVVGHVGKAVTRGQIDTILGLDPAGPLFSVDNPANRLAATDARYVEAIHTNGGGTGIGAPIAQADFFPNGGSSQPGCLTPTCSHDRAVDFWVEALRSNRFFGFRCNSHAEAVAENCAGQPGAWISSEPSNSNNNVNGIFHFQTNRLSPFAQGPLRP